MKIHNIIILVLVVSMIALGCMAYITDLGENYGATADLSSMDNTRHRLEVQQNISRDLSDDITSFKLEGITDAILIPYKMIKVGWGIAKTIFGSWTTTGAMIEDTAAGVVDAGIPLPDWLMPSIISIIVIILVAIIVYAFFKWRFTD